MRVPAIDSELYSQHTTKSTCREHFIHRTMFRDVMANMVHGFRNLCNIGVLALILGAGGLAVFAQEGGPPSDRQSQGGEGRGRRGGFGGFGGRGGFGVTGELRNDATLQELGLSEESLAARLDDLQQRLNTLLQQRDALGGKTN